ncbi:MAG: hypothetical protein H0U76_28505 [Ktedonobacteraceae bacterium]|nr:hypothetical protein [Ktedonobacteraceae bacterium]
MFDVHPLLLQIPREIPGLGSDYIPTAAADITWGIFEVVFQASIGLFGIFTLIALLLLLFTDGHWHAGAKEMIGGLFLVLFMLSQYQVIYGANFRMWTALARAITTQEKADQYRSNWMQAADPDYLKTLTPEEQTKLPFYARLSLAASVINPTGTVISELYVMLLTPIFFAEQAFLYALWRMMANILFMFGPICIVFGVFGKRGRHVVLAWVGALIQMGLWGVWNAVMAIILNNAQDMFYKAPGTLGLAVTEISGNSLAIPNYYEELIIMAGVMFLSVLGPVMISLLVPFIPHSNFVGLGSIAIMRSAKSHVDMAAGAAKATAGAMK